MLHATELLGADTYDSHGNFVGRVKEMFVEPGDQPNRVSKIPSQPWPIPPSHRALRPDWHHQPGPRRPHHRRISFGTLSPQRKLSRDWQRFARPANHRHQRPQSRPRERHRPRRQPHQRKHRAANHSGGHRTCRRRPQAAARRRSAHGHSQNPSQIAASKNSVGIRQPCRARSAPPRKAAPIERKTRCAASGRSRRHHGATLPRRAPGHHRFTRRTNRRRNDRRARQAPANTSRRKTRAGTRRRHHGGNESGRSRRPDRQPRARQIKRSLARNGASRSQRSGRAHALPGKHRRRHDDHRNGRRR